MAKIGRNHPCPCGSGKKYKRCHGAVARAMPPRMVAQVDASRRAHEAKELLRARAEGHGRPVIALDAQGVRVVAVGSRVFQSRNWRFFTDFLLDYLKSVFGPGWAKRMNSGGQAHGLLRWLDMMLEVQKRAVRGGSGVIESRGDPVVSTVFRFAYALYLIAHHDRMPPALLKRLRQPSEFLPAVTETFSVAAFALAGFKIEMGEIKKGAGPEGEFTATSTKTGKAFNVEAKRKQGWKSEVAIDDPAFQTELKLWLQRKLYLAARKKLDNPVYWFELSLPNIDDKPKAEKVQALVRDALRDAEKSIRISGEVPSPAYVFVTSHAFQAGFDDDTTLFMLEGFHIPMSKNGDHVDAEQAMIERDRDRDMAWVFECLHRVQQVPHHFDGTPDELVGDDKRPIDRLQIGQRLEVTFDDAPSVSGLVVEAVSTGKSASIVLLNEVTGAQSIVEIPLTEDEQRAAAALGDAVFGNPRGTKRIADDDPLALYDFLLEAYAATSREKLLEFAASHSRFAEFEALSTEDLRIRVCREWMKSILLDQQQRKAAAPKI